MKINKSSRFEPLIFLLIATLFFSAGVKFEIRLFAVWGIVSVVFAAAIFLIHKFSKRRTENVYVPLFFLFAGCLVICAGLFELRDKFLILAGGVFMAFGVLMGFLFSSEGQRIKDEKLRNSIRMPSEYIVLFAVKETEENNDVKWYVIDKRTGRAYVFAENKYALTDFGTVRMLACSKYARCFMVDEMKKRSFWADFSEDNWWRKLKIKFDKEKNGDIPDNMGETFVCKVCKKRKEMKYLHRNQTCADCCEDSAASSVKPPLPSKKKDSSSGMPQAKGFCLGEFNSNREDYQRLRNAGARYIPQKSGAIERTFLLLSYLSAIMDEQTMRRCMETKLEEERRHAESADSHDHRVFTDIALSVEVMLLNCKPESLKERVAKMDPESLLKAWCTLDYYAFFIKADFIKSILHLRDYIQDLLIGLEKNLSEDTFCAVSFRDCEVHIDTKKLMEWKKNHPLATKYEKKGALLLTEKEPKILLYEDGAKIREFVLRTENEEDFTNKYFLISVWITHHGNPAAMAVQMDGIISDTPQDRTLTWNDIGYRMEGCFLLVSGDASDQKYEMMRGRDLEMKALKYQGLTTPANIRLVGVCPECGKSFAFHGYAFYMAQDDVVYSDDGLDVCTVSSYEIDKDKVYEVEGKKFRYYNSFNCPHCLKPYIDYKKYPEMKKFGVSGCVHLGRKYYKASGM